MEQLSIQRIPFRDSIAFRFLAVAITSLAIVSLLFSGLQLYSAYRRELNTLQEQAREKARFLGAVTPEWVYVKDFIALETLMRQTAEEGSIVYSLVLGMDGQSLTRYRHTTDPLVAQAIEEANSGDILELVTILDQNPDIRQVRSPIVTEGLQLGEVWIGYSTEIARRHVLRDAVTVLGGSVMLSLVLAALTILLFNRYVRRPLEEVGDLAQALATGDLHQRADVYGSTEVDQLKLAFNSMAGQLQQTLRGLRRANESAEKANSALRASEAEARKLSQVASRTDNMVIISDSQGRVEWVNDAFIRVTGYTLDEVQGQRPGGLLQGSETDAQTVAFMREQIQQVKGFRCEVLNYDKWRRPYWVELEVQPIYDEVGHLTNFIAVESDITERRTAAVELQRAKNEAEAANQAKSAFLANMSHELRTPLNAILGYTELLLEEAVDQNQSAIAQDLGKIHSAGKHLLALISDILDLSKVEAGKMELFVESVQVDEVVRSVLTTVQPLMEANQNQISCAIDPHVGVIETDLTKLKQILFNLLSNGAKFTQAGQISVTVTRSAEPPTFSLNGHSAKSPSDWVRFEVTDTGIGMGQEQLQRLFQPFSQGDPSTTRRYGGTGLGLTIIQRFCEIMGGSIDVLSEEEVGSTFIVHLPATLDRQTTGHRSESSDDMVHLSMP